MRTLWICSALTVVLALTACGMGTGALKAYGACPWPVYDEPQALGDGLTDAEKATVLEFVNAHKDVWKKIQGQSNAWRAIVRTHNRRAVDVNIAQLKALGYEEDASRKMVAADVLGRCKNLEPDLVAKLQPKPKSGE